MVFSNNAFALGKVSRACNFNTIPWGLKNVAATFFVKVIGAQPWVLGLPDLSDEDQKDYWILESLTTDIIYQKYYLYAAAHVYTIIGFVDDHQSNLNVYVKHWKSYESPWTSETVPDAIKADPLFTPYFANRRYLYSARAGDPAIVMKIQGAHGGQRFLVQGKHSYYDAASKLTADYGSSQATNCNLPSTGFGLFDR